MTNRYNKYPIKTVTTDEKYTHITEHNKVYHSSFINISSCIKISNLDKIISSVINNNNDKERYKNILHEHLTNNNLFNIETLTTFYKDLKNYNNNILFSSNENLERFIGDYKKGVITRYFNVRYSIGERNKNKDRDENNKEVVSSIYIDFNVDIFNKLYNTHENWHETEIVYRHLFVLFLILVVIEDFISDLSIEAKEKFYLKLSRCLRNYVSLSVLTGMKLYTDFDLGSPYGELYEELIQLTPLRRNEMIFNYCPENRTFEIIIKDYSFISYAYAAWWNNAWTEKDIGKKIETTTHEKPYVIKKEDVMLFDSNDFIDTQDISTVRIIQTENPNIIRVTAELTGMRIISRVLSASGNATDKIFSDELGEYAALIPDEMTACFLWRLFWRTEQYQNKFKDIKKSYCNTYIKFVKNMEGSNDIVAKSAVIILLSKMEKKDREEFININITDAHTKKWVRKALSNLDRRLKSSVKKDTEAELIKFIWGLKQYVW